MVEQVKQNYMVRGIIIRTKNMDVLSAHAPMNNYAN